MTEWQLGCYKTGGREHRIRNELSDHTQYKYRLFPSLMCISLKMHCRYSSSALKIWMLQLSRPSCHTFLFLPYLFPQPSSSHPSYRLRLPGNWGTTQDKDLGVTHKDVLLEAEALMSSVEGTCWERHQQGGRRAKGEHFIWGRNRLGDHSSGETKGMEATGGKWV